MAHGSEADFAAFETKMQHDGLPQIVIDNFRHYYTLLTSGGEGLIAETDIRPVEATPQIGELAAYASAGQEALGQTVVIKLNGGLGTSMGLDGPKSLLPVREGLNFLDIIIRQILAFREHAGARVPLVLMNSFNTDAATREVLARYPELASDLPMVMLQHRVPKVRKADFAPATYPADPDLEWCPPGHGEIYIALATSGLLSQLIERGYQYAFVSNVDNLGATLDTRILGYIASERVPFLMEVASRTDADKKGGHLAQSPNGQLLLREVAQCPPEDIGTFQDITRHRFFNTNNIWLNLHVLRDLLLANGNVLKLPMIRNEKTVDPKDATSAPVYQLETAMGAAIGVVPGARALCVGRDRFMPVKTCADLLSLRSDMYGLDAEGKLFMQPARQGRPITVTLDTRYYKVIDDFETRFPSGAPSLIGCDRLTVTGDVVFGPDVACVGAVHVLARDGEQMFVSGIQIADETLDLTEVPEGT